MKKTVPENLDERVRIREEKILSHDFYLLRKVTFEYQRRDGEWQTQTRESYNRGNGCAILLYNLPARTIVLVRQFRFSVFEGGYRHRLLEAPAGVLEGADPEERIRRETEEETGYRALNVRKVFEAFMSPGSVTEKLYFFVAEYDPKNRVGEGGGLAQEGEDIEVVELPLTVAARMIEESEIVDAKAIMLIQWAQLNLKIT